MMSAAAAAPAAAAADAAPVPKSTTHEFAARMAEGKRLRAKGEWSAASALFADLMQDMSRIYGELGPEMGDIYHIYGTTLLEESKNNDSLLGGETAKGDGKPESASAAAAAAAPAADDDDDDDGDDDDGNDDEEDGGEEGGEDAKPASPDVPTLQIAWEVLECARIIFSKNTEKESQLKLASVHFDLGEFNLEMSAFSDAAAELETCLRLRQEFLAADSRDIAEVHYWLALAYQYAKNFPKAISHFNMAKAIIQANIDSTNTDPAEAENLRSVLHDLIVKIKDAEDESAFDGARVIDASLPNAMAAAAGESELKMPSRETFARLQAEPAAVNPFGAAATSSAAAAAPVQNINTLVRKKKPAAAAAAPAAAAPAAAASSDEPDAKRQRTQ